ncbi:MAG: hypothetical protein R3F19_09565 [Verrucomicrobiales bacterium]
MKTIGLDTIAAEIASDGFVKCIVNSSAAIPGTTQHRDVKRDGVSYEGDYRGNAMAATITPGRIDIRFHKEFPDDTVSSISANFSTFPRWFGLQDSPYFARRFFSW